MASISFSCLPPELLCRIFESADDFSVVAALGRTARIFYDIWRANPTSICEAVAPRVLSNLAVAERLVDVQEEAEASKQSQTQQHGCDKANSCAQRLLFNARCASAACDSWVSVCEIHHYPDRGENPGMKPPERARFEHAFYRVWTVGVMAKARIYINKRRYFWTSAVHESCTGSTKCQCGFDIIMRTTLDL